MLFKETDSILSLRVFLYQNRNYLSVKKALLKVIENKKSCNKLQDHIKVKFLLFSEIREMER